MGKVPDSFEKFEWPWKKGEMDEDRVAKLVWNARRDEQAAEEKVQEQRDKVTQLQTKLDAAEAAKSGTDAEGQQKIQDLTKELRDLKAAKTDGPRPEDQRTIDQLRVALQLGLDPEDAERLRGDDFDAILADGKDFAERHGIELEGDEGDNGSGGGNDGTPPQGGYPGVQPVSSFRSGGSRRPPAAKPDAEGAKKLLPPLRY